MKHTYKLFCICVLIVSLVLSMVGCASRNDTVMPDGNGNGSSLNNPDKNNDPTNGDNGSAQDQQKPDDDTENSTDSAPENPSDTDSPSNPGNTGNTGDTGNTGNAGNSGNVGNTGNTGNTGNSDSAEGEQIPDSGETPTEAPETEPEEDVNTGVLVEVSADVTSENNVLTEGVTLAGENMSANVPQGVVLDENTTQLVLTVTEKEASDSGIELTDGQTMLPLDVHIQGVSTQNTAPIMVNLGAILPKGLNIGNYSLYHVENGVSNKMTAVYSADELNVHNNFMYDPTDGNVTVSVASFSEIALVSEAAVWEGEFDFTWYDSNRTDDTFYIRNADQLAAFGAIVGGMLGREHDSFAGKTVVLLSDIDLGDDEVNNVEGKIFYPIGYWNDEGTYEKNQDKAISSGFYPFEGTFDGNGNTIANFYQNTWEMKGDHNWYAPEDQHFRDGMGLFGKVYGGTVKNLIVKNFSSDGEITTTGVIAAYADSGNGKSATFENISIFNCNPRVYNIGNGGIVGCAGWYSREDATAKDYPVTFKNITVDQTNKISALWGTYDVSCGGILGQYYPDSACGLLFEKCHVAAVMDVNNDVCANYQYYWYRYSGMLMGTVRSNTKDEAGYTVADTTGITVKDCTYTYGAWNEYWYCELVKNSPASYTHDYQFSRLTTIKDIGEIATLDGEGNVTEWLKEGNFVIPNEDNTAATCYHIFKDSNGEFYRHYHDQGDESNGNEAYETINGERMLKEDRTCYYIPFGQVLNGLGYGVKPTYEIEGFTLVKDGTVISRPKFEVKDDARTTYVSGTGEKIYLKDLFDLCVNLEKLSQSSLYVAASPIDDNSTVAIKYNRDVDNWENSYFTIEAGSTGSVKIVITDYFYCTPTEVVITVNIFDSGEDGDIDFDLE